jgi:hypothetical protein
MDFYWGLMMEAERKVSGASLLVRGEQGRDGAPSGGCRRADNPGDQGAGSGDVAGLRIPGAYALKKTAVLAHPPRSAKAVTGRRATVPSAEYPYSYAVPDADYPLPRTVWPDLWKELHP